MYAVSPYSLETTQQSRRVSGTVVDQSGEPIIGANVLEKGTTNGVITDIDGNFAINASANATLEISFIGYITESVKVTGSQPVRVALKEDAQSLEEVVVVGYGVQKKKLITGATVQVGGDNLTKLSTSSALSGLQSQTPGVNITQNSGQPGAGFKVIIRGMGTVGDYAPLYVIDGVSGGDINNLNTSDIESVDVLKDAASAAIYGSRAANGVILVTTKQGKAGKTQVTYDGYYGVQNIYKMPSMLNAKQYMTIQDETIFNERGEVYDWSKQIPQYLLDKINDGSWQGTNWLDAIRNVDAPTQNHGINLTGGNDNSRFSLGFSYAGQEGTLGKPVAADNDRYTARINTEHVILKTRGVDVIKLGENLTYVHSTSNGISTGNQFGNDVHFAIRATPLLPIYNQEGGYYSQDDKSAEGWNLQGSIGNPIYDMALGDRGLNKSVNYSLNANAYLEIQPIKDLKLRSTFGFNQYAWTYRSYNGIRNVSTTTSITQDQVNQSGGSGHGISWENTLQYVFRLNQEHAFDALVGQSLQMSGWGEQLNANGKNSIFPGSFEHAYLVNTKPSSLDELGIGGSPNGTYRSASFFGRVNYNYKETYLFTGILRADASSNFARSHRWGYFPSLSAGWVLTNESFMESASASGIDFLKLRVSWGQNGNERISAFQYLATIAMDNRNAYYFGESKESPTTGAYADILPNPDVSWEISEQINLGVDARFLNQRLGLAFDLYQKTTKDWLVTAPQLATFGTGAPYINGGDIRNQGIELALNWNDRIGNFSYGVNLNLDFTKNEVTKLANSEGILHGPSNVLSQGTTEMYRAEIGKPIGYFWGYKTEGVFQNQAQIDNYRANGIGVLETAQPGDLIFSDTNKDGGINDSDKVMLGKPHPDWTGGLSFTLGYKGFDFSTTTYGNFGMQLAKSYRAFADSPLQNYTTDIFGRWHGEGTSNKLPRLTSGSHSNWQNISDIYFEDGDFVKISNVTLGYDFKKLLPRLPFGQTRLYVTAQNLYTFTGYSGMDPEVGYGGGNNWGGGIDLGYYPSARTYLIGVNLKF
jgi:TonB-linked SusC/RagA family outer membrane protein